MANNEQATADCQFANPSQKAPRSIVERRNLLLCGTLQEPSHSPFLASRTEQLNRQRIENIARSEVYYSQREIRNIQFLLSNLDTNLTSFTIQLLHIASTRPFAPPTSTPSNKLPDLFLTTAPKYFRCTSHPHRPFAALTSINEDILARIR